MNLVHPSDTMSRSQFMHERVSGSLDAHLANFGRFQLGSSITAHLYVPKFNRDGCNSFGTEEKSYA